ncbi:MAG: helix-turn-helix transcriptional regulator [Flavipsychrobacter sp.]|jgi:y4mF family transcriptional regulator|nr:helix-turn-helix transcriptional regulator [Flavipsychrobacter sp.]
MEKHIKMFSLQAFVKAKRKEAGLTQQQFAEKAGVALTVIRKIEQGKNDLQLEKVNQVLKMFGHILAPISIKSVIDEKG